MRELQDCPKCGQAAEFSYQYERPGTSVWVNGAHFQGPCLIRACGVCSYTYSEPPRDGEGT